MSNRFMVDDAGTLIDMQTRDMFDIVEEVVDLLNEQHEKIQRLEQNIDELLSVNVEEDLLKENEQLRTKNNAYIQDIEVFKEENTYLKLENEELKLFNQDLSENLAVCANARISKDTRIERLEEKIQRERTSFTKTHERWSKEAENKIKELSKENEQLKQKLKSIEDGFEFSCTENYTEFDKDKLYVKDTHTKIHLDDRNLFIEVYIPQSDEFYRFKYTITGKSLMREFIENYNLKGDVE